MDELFWALLIVVCAIGPLVIFAFVVEVVAPKSRSWLKRVRSIEAGRKAMEDPESYVV